MRCALLIGILAFLTVRPARADEFITYTLSGYFSGTLTTSDGTIPIGAQEFSIALTADLNAVENNIANGNFYTPFEPSITYTLPGLGTGTYVDSIAVGRGSDPSTFAFDDENSSWIAMSSPDFASYDLVSPITLTGITIFTDMPDFTTTYGTVTPTQGAFQDATFIVTVTPELPTLLPVAFAGAVLFFPCILRKRHLE